MIPPLPPPHPKMAKQKVGGKGLFDIRGKLCLGEEKETCTGELTVCHYERCSAAFFRYKLFLSFTVCQSNIILILAVGWLFGSWRWTRTIWHYHLTKLWLKVCEKHVLMFSLALVFLYCILADKAVGALQNGMDNRCHAPLSSSLPWLTLVGFPTGRLTSTMQTPEWAVSALASPICR